MEDSITSCVNGHEGFIMSDYALKYIIDYGAMILYDHYIDNQIPIYNTATTLMMMSGVIEEQFLVKQFFFFLKYNFQKAQDKGESKYQLMNKWVEEEEPKVIRLDNIATLSVNTKTKMTDDEVDIDDLKSLRSSSSKRSRISMSQLLKKSVHKLQIATKLAPTPQRSAFQSPLTQQTVVLEEDTYQFNLVEMPDEKPPPEEDPIADRMREEREYKHKDQLREAERLRKQKEEQQLFEEKRKEQQRQLKNKPVTYDYNGDLIFIKSRTGDTPGLQSNEIINLDVKSREPPFFLKENCNVPEIVTVRDLLGGVLEKFPQKQYRNQTLIEVKDPRTGQIIVNQEKPQQKKQIEQQKKAVEVQVELEGRKKKNIGDQKMVIENPKTSGQITQLKESIYESQCVSEVNVQMLPSLSQLNSKKINIESPERYMMLIAGDTRKKTESRVYMKRNNKQKLFNGHANLYYSKAKLERVNDYRRESAEQRKSTELKNVSKNSKLHEAVDKFDQEVLNNPNWGETEMPKDSPSKITATSYKQRRQKKRQSSPYLLTKTRSTFFPPIKQPVPNPRAQRVT